MFSSIKTSLMEPSGLSELMKVKKSVGRRALNSIGDSAACDLVCKQRFHNNSLDFISADKETHKTKISRQIQRIQNRKSIVGKPTSRVEKCKIIVGLQTKK